MTQKEKHTLYIAYYNLRYAIEHIDYPEKLPEVKAALWGVDKAMLQVGAYELNTPEKQNDE